MADEDRDSSSVVSSSNTSGSSGSTVEIDDTSVLFSFTITPIQVERTEQSSEEMDHFEEQIDKIKKRIDDDLLACDAKYSLFVAAATSYRANSRLIPFPPKCRNMYGKDFKKLNDLHSEMMPFPVLNFNAEQGVYDEFHPEAIDLVHWVLFGPKDYDLRTLCRDEKEEFIQKWLKKKDPAPKYVFEVQSKRELQVEQRFEANKIVFSSGFAFHGSKIDNFHSILHNGLQQRLCENDLFGRGIYLAKDLLHSLLYSPHGATWGSSQLGQLVSCVALCEYVKNKLFTFESKDDEDNTVPDKYVLVKNDEMVRVRYLLFYTKTIAMKPRRENDFINWVKNHTYLFTLFIYGIFLFLIGLSSLETVSYIRYFMSKFFKFLKSFF